MTFKECKFGCRTSIEWDTQLNGFRESDGRLHDRKRCEGLRPAKTTNNGGQQQQQQNQSTVTTTSDSPLAAVSVQKEQWDYLVATLTKINTRLDVLAEYYNSMIEATDYVRKVHATEERLRQEEEAYDQAKEDGLA